MTIATWTMCVLAAATFDDPRQPPERLALIVGVADYPEGSEWEDLKGPVNDADLARATLIRRFGFDASEIVVLVNEQATHEAVVRAFHEHLIERAGPETECVFWYSGHGSRVPDASGFEATAMDSTYVLSDSRIVDPAGGYDLSDDQLRALVDALCAKSRRVLVVSDSCHSGGVTRGNGRGKSMPAGTKSLARDSIARFWPIDLPLLDDDVAPNQRPGFVHIAACGSEQQAEEDPLPYDFGPAHGYLTFALCYYLEHASPGDSFREVTARAAAWVSRWEYDQSVTCSGDVDRTLFSGEFSPAPPGFAFHVVSDREVKVLGGRFHGVRPRTVFVIRDERGVELGRARASFVETADSYAIWDGPMPSGLESIPARAVIDPRSGARHPLRIVFADGAFAAFGKAVSDWQDVVAVEPPGAPGAHVLETTATEPAKLRVTLRDPTGRATFTREAPAESIRSLDADLLAAFDAERTHAELLALGDAAEGIPIRCELAPSIAGREGRYAPRIVTRDASADSIAYEVFTDPGESRAPEVELRLTNVDAAPVRFSVLALGADRSRTVLYPVGEGERDDRVPPGESRTFRFDPGRPESEPARDRYLVFATRDYVDFSALESRSPTRGGDAPDSLSRAFGIDERPATRGSSDHGVRAFDVYVR